MLLLGALDYRLWFPVQDSRVLQPAPVFLGVSIWNLQSSLRVITRLQLFLIGTGEAAIVDLVASGGQLDDVDKQLRRI